MPISSPEVTIEAIINDGFADLINNASEQIPLIFSEFPQSYIDETIEYLTSPDFKIQTVFSYYFDPAILPAFNIVLANEGESPLDKQMYLGDIVESATGVPNTEPYSRIGSDWTCSVAIIIRAQKARQCIVLYNILKWIILKNRMTMEAAGMKATKISGSDLAYTPTSPTFIFNRQIKVDCRIFNTVDTDVTSGEASLTVNSVVSRWPREVRVLEQSNEVLGGDEYGRTLGQ